MILNNYQGEKVITDIDDCLIKTSFQIRKKGITPKVYWMKKGVREKLDSDVFLNAPLTKWGKEFTQRVRNGEISNYELITSASGRKELIKQRFDCYAKEGMSNQEKLTYLESISEPSIYVDDKLGVIIRLRNKLVKKIRVR